MIKRVQPRGLTSVWYTALQQRTGQTLVCQVVRQCGGPRHYRNNRAWSVQESCTDGRGTSGQPDGNFSIADPAFTYTFLLLAT